jgi:SAM-dependent methyltransferase
MDFRETVRKGYDAIAERYLAGRRRDSEDVRLLGEFMQRLPAGAQVLDAGCGAGVPVSQMLSERFELIGVDFSEAQIGLARKHVPNANFICKDMTDLDFPDNTFDGICSYYAIIHIPREEHRSLIANFWRMLKPGGLALLCLGAEPLVDDFHDEFLGTRMYWSHYDAETYLGMLKECGFSIIWSRQVADQTCQGARHLFVLAYK